MQSFSSPSSFNIYSHNVSGAKSKITKMNNALAITIYDVLCFQETWYDHSIDTAELVASTNYTCIRQDRSTFLDAKATGGGVLILVANSLTFVEIVYDFQTCLEWVGIRLTMNKLSYNILNVYFPPYRTRSRMADELSDILRKIHAVNINDHVILLGDFNTPKIRWSIDEQNAGFLRNSGTALTRYERKLLQVVAANHVTSVNSLPNSNGKFLDHVYSTDISNTSVEAVDTLYLIDANSTHHNALQIRVTYQSTSKRKHSFTRNTFNANLTKCKHELSLVNMDDYTIDIASNEIPRAHTVVGKIESFQSLLVSCQNRNTSKRYVHRPKGISNHPWVCDKTYEALFMARSKAKEAHNTANTVDTRVTLRNVNIALAERYNFLRTQYYEQLVTNAQGNSHEFFMLMRTKRHIRSSLPIIMKLGPTSYFGIDRIHALCMNLSSCFTAASLPTNDSARRYDLFKIYNENYDSNLAHIWNNHVDTFTANQVEKAILELDEKKDCGPMGLSVKFLKFNCQLISAILANFFNAIFKSGIMPRSWSHAFLAPIPKKGNLLDVKNYRGIAMQSAVPKIFDKLITNCIYSSVETIIPTNQHGFVRNKSTVSNLVEITQYLHEHIGVNQRVDVIYFDFTKAFDVINHRILATKLAKIAMPYPLFAATMNFISHRHFTLKSDGKSTDISFESRSGVPQGSHCGPLLFLLMSRDVVSCVVDTLNEMLMYADDTKMFRVVNGLTDMYELQSSIDKLHRWTIDNELPLNSIKTLHVSFTRRKLITHTQYYIGMDRILRVDRHRDLGVLFDEKLTFVPHVNEIVEKSNRLFGMINRFAKEIHHPPIATKILKTYVTPIVEYASSVWWQNRVISDGRLERILHKLTRLSLQTGFRPNLPNYVTFQERLRQLNLLTFAERREIASAVFILKILKEEIRSTMLEKIFASRRLHVDHIRNPTIFNVSRNLPAKSPLALGMSTINKYRNVFSLQDSVQTAKNKMKHHLADQRQAALN